MKNNIRVLFVVLIDLVLVACGTDKQTTNGDDSYTVGILQFMEHNSLTAAKDGFMAELEESGLDINLEVLNSQGDQSNLQSMSEQLSKNTDLMLAIATPAAQALATVEQDKPILFTAVTDAVDAGLVDSNEVPGRNLTGTSDMVPIDQQIALLLSIVPDADTIGIIYSSSEPNSKIQADLAIEALEAAGVNVEVSTVTSTNDVQQVVTSLAPKIDGLYIPTDNTIASTIATVGEVAREYNLPVVGGDSNQVEGGALATYGISYEELGRQTARMAIKILQDGQSPAELPVEFSDNLELTVNEEMANAIGIDPKSISMD